MNNIFENGGFSWFGDMFGEPQSFEEMLKEAEKGDTCMMQEVARAYLQGDGVEQDFKKAVYWFEKMADDGDSSAMFNLGLHYIKGCGVERSFKEALKWLEKADECGDGDAEGLIKLIKEADENLAKAESGDAQAQADLARFFMTYANMLEESGVEEFFGEAFKWAKKSAEQNNPDGLYSLALAYEHGRGVDEDVEEARKYYETAALMGNAPSIHNLAVYYAKVEENVRLAFELEKIAADMGYPLGMEGLAWCYQVGNGVMGSMKKALYWYEKAYEATGRADLKRRVDNMRPIFSNDESEYYGVDSDKELTASEKQFVDKIKV